MEMFHHKTTYKIQQEHRTVPDAWNKAGIFQEPVTELS